METSTQVTLSWKEFEHCAGNALRDLHSDQDFADVTLACMDDVQIKAHKFVLSASSLFFKNILTKTAHSHPFLYLKGISGKVLEALLAFMYKGESKVLEADLKEFLDTADELKIRGLFDVAKDFAPSIKSEPPTVYEAHQDQGEEQPIYQQVHVESSNWAAHGTQAFLGLQELQDLKTSQSQATTSLKCSLCKFEATSVDNLSLHAKNFHPTKGDLRSKPQQKLVKTVKCNICQMVLINDKRNLLEHCKVYHMNA